MTDLKDHIIDFMELNTDPALPFSDVLDAAIRRSKTEMDRRFADYERVAGPRRAKLIDDQRWAGQWSPSMSPFPTS